MAFFMSGPIECQALSGPLDGGGATTAADNNGGGVPFSAPLGGTYVRRKRRKTISGIRKALYRNFSVVPVKNFISGGGGVGRQKDVSVGQDIRTDATELGASEINVQRALGKSGEDRVHVVISEELGWLFVGIYDGFNGPDAPEFLMSHLYKAMYNELEGLFWDTEDTAAASGNADLALNSCPSDVGTDNQQEFGERKDGETELQSVKKVAFGGEQVVVKRRRLWEYLAEDGQDHGLDLSGSDRFAFSVDDALSVKDAGSAVNRRSLLLSKLKHGLLNKQKRKESSRSFPWRFWLERKQKETEETREGNVAGGGDGEGETVSRIGRTRSVGLADHELVLSAMARALEGTEKAYLDMTDRVLDWYPELALMGSCLLVALMKDEDVYVMNVGDSRATVAQYEPEEVICGTESLGLGVDSLNGEGIVEGSAESCERKTNALAEARAHQCRRLTALQLSTDHSTSIQEQKLNEVLLEMFRNDYIGTAPYISCSPSLQHHKLCPRDQFLVLSSDGLYQYFRNEEVVSHVENFMEKYPDGDPAQHLIEKLLTRAARKDGMDFHELLDIPQGDRRKYHDDVTVMVVSLEGRIWKSSGKYL